MVNSRTNRYCSGIIIAVSACALAGCGSLGVDLRVPSLTHGIASGDVTATSAVVWARADREALMHVSFAPEFDGGNGEKASAVNSRATDFTAQVVLEDLTPDTTYTYEVWFENSRGISPMDTGRFRTAPTFNDPADVKLIWGGDLGGQGYCRRLGDGYPVFDSMRALEPDFFIASGDMIYADYECPAKGPEVGWVNIEGDFPAISNLEIDWEDQEQVQRIYAAHWRYHRADSSYQEFLQLTPVYVQWDDHEVIDDFGANWKWLSADPQRFGYPNIVDVGKKFLFNFNPIQRQEGSPDRIYRSFRWGDALEFFILDPRSYRSENFLEDSVDNAKTMLGDEQLEWLKEGLAQSTATWKAIVGGVPLSFPSGEDANVNGRDSWANGLGLGYAARTGFELELLDLLGSLDRNRVQNVVFLNADTHFPAQLRYEVDINGDGHALLFHELISGPLSAGADSPPDEFDPSFAPEVLYAEGNIFNFGTVTIQYGAEGVPILHSDIRDTFGHVRPGSLLELTPQDSFDPSAP